MGTVNSSLVHPTKRPFFPMLPVLFFSTTIHRLIWNLLRKISISLLGLKKLEKSLVLSFWITSLLTQKNHFQLKRKGSFAGLISTFIAKRVIASWLNISASASIGYISITMLVVGFMQYQNIPLNKNGLWEYVNKKSVRK